MKNIIVYLWIIVAGVSFAGCYDLDTYPADNISSGTFWKTEDHVKQALMGVYASLKADQAFGLYFMFDNLGETAYGYDGQAYEQAFRGTYTARTDWVGNKWAALYDGIRRANEFIVKAAKVEALDEAAKAKYVAEAKFMRALCYFHLLDFYGGVPYYDETTDVGAEYADMKKPRSTAEQIRGYIVADLNEAISTLDVTRPAAEYGRVTKGAAYALRGKVYLYNREWNSAISDFEEIVYNKTANYGYGLHGSYSELFALYNGMKSDEMIFAIQNKGGVGNPYGMKLAFYLGTRSTYGGCWNNSVPSGNLVDMYECPDGKPFNWDNVFPGYSAADVATRQNWLQIKLTGDGQKIESLLNADTAKILNAYKNRDPRLMATVIAPYSTYKGWRSNASKDMMLVLHSTANGGGTPHESNGFIRNNNGAWSTCFWRKFVPESDLGGAISVRDHTPFEFPLIRLGDVLLMLSEAYNETDQLDRAVAELNKVRERVGMPGLNSGAAWLAVATKAEMTERIRRERAVELAAEGHRFSDLRRWGIAKTVLAKLPAKNIYGGTQYTHEFLDRDMLWPIPGVEIERNPALGPNNPGW
jgi:hypothetical protein